MRYRSDVRSGGPPTTPPSCPCSSGVPTPEQVAVLAVSRRTRGSVERRARSTGRPRGVGGSEGPRHQAREARRALRHGHVRRLSGRDCHGVAILPEASPWATRASRISHNSGAGERRDLNPLDGKPDLGLVRRHRQRRCAQSGHRGGGGGELGDVHRVGADEVGFAGEFGRRLCAVGVQHGPLLGVSGDRGAVRVPGGQGDRVGPAPVARGGGRRGRGRGGRWRRRRRAGRRGCWRWSTSSPRSSWATRRRRPNTR